jgi:hypothetical protein
MEKKITIEECEQWRGELIESLRSSALAEDLKSEIDNFAERTKSYIEKAKEFQSRVFKLCGNADNESHQEVLRVFKERMDALKNKKIPMSDSYVPFKDDVEIIEMLKRTDKKLMKGNLKATVEFLDISQEMLFVKALEKFKGRADKNKPPRSLH